VVTIVTTVGILECKVRGDKCSAVIGTIGSLLAHIHKLTPRMISSNLKPSGRIAAGAAV
jgi:hypothetical protein